MFFTIFIAVLLAIVVGNAISSAAERKRREDELTVGSKEWNKSIRDVI